MKYEVKFTSQFKKDLKLAKKQNKNLDRLFETVNIIASGGTLDASCRDHELSGNYKGTRECHIEPDWLLLWIYSRRHISSVDIFPHTRRLVDLFPMTQKNVDLFPLTLRGC